jgi:xanthine dehydrogenase small subunit
MTNASFQLNGRSTALGGDPTESLLRWLRRQRLTGTKEGCADGDCGACTVALAEPDPDGTPRWRAVNSCLLPIGALPGRRVLTVEALADGGALHPVQQALVDSAGSQCGYCTPGFVMSLFVAQRNGHCGSDAAIEGNLCRCTGYQPIRAAAAQLAAQPRGSDARDALLEGSTLAAGELGPFHSPATLEEALLLKTRYPDALWICGGTDLGVELSHGKRPAEAFIALDRIAALQTLEVGDEVVTIGAGVPLARLEHELHGVFPELDALLPWFAAGQVRNRATLGGNLGSASPIGDLLPWLLARDARIVLQGPQGVRELAADDFFLAYRKTARRADELVTRVVLPRQPGLWTASHKVAKRQTDDISIVLGVFALGLDARQRVAHARLAYGGVAAIPLRARTVEQFLLGRTLDEATVAEAVARLETAFTPLSDHRAGADYRRALCGALFARFVAERPA